MTLNVQSLHTNSKREHAKFISLLFVSLCLTPSCKKTVRPVIGPGFILGPNDMIASSSSTMEFNNVPLSQIRATGAIASMESGRGLHHCTGFAVAPLTNGQNPTIVTNYHCFTKSGQNSGDFAPWACAQTKIYFGLKTDDFNSLFVASCKPGTLRGHAAADIAVFESLTPLPADIQLLTLSTTPRAGSARAHVIHHPVNQGNMIAPPGEMAPIPASIITAAHCEVKLPTAERVKRPDDGFLFDMSHTCDISEGSSGAPVIDTASGSVIGVNWGGVDYDGTESGLENRAVDAAWVHAFLNNTLSTYEEVKTAIAQNSGNAAPESPNRAPETSRTSTVKSRGCSL